MENQKAFLKIPVLTIIIAGILILSGFGYLGFKQYQKIQEENISKEKIALEQQKALEQAQVEIEKLKEGNEITQAKQKELEQNLYIEKLESKTQNYFISSTEINKYITGVVLIKCSDSEGSGFLMNLNSGYSIVTNDHVVAENAKCGAMPYDNSEINMGYFDLDLKSQNEWNNYTDITILKMSIPVNIVEFVKPIASLNYNLSKLRLCQDKMPVGSPVVVLGYPAFGKHISETGRLYEVPVSDRQTTEGVISGYYKSSKLPYLNYYVSAKIDSGNSGGISFSKDSNGLCLLGVPTWVSIGNFETQGMVQNMQNVMYDK